MFTPITKIISVIAILTSFGCSLDSLVKVDDPEQGRELSKDAVKSREGALGLYYSSLGLLRQAISINTMEVALFTDELAAGRLVGDIGSAGENKMTDARLESLDKYGRRFKKFSAYGYLHGARVGAHQAREVLIKLGDPTVKHLIAGTYAIEGYSILYLAENGCSGIPLSVVPFEGSVEYGHGLTSSEMFNAAKLMFDSAEQQKHDSARFTTLAKIGKARSYLGLGVYDSANLAVEGIQDSDIFTVNYTAKEAPGTSGGGRYGFSLVYNSYETSYQVENKEGINGLVWYDNPEDIDPRVNVETVLSATTGKNVFPSSVLPKKYLSTEVAFPVARGIEALLIRAEYYLNIGDPNWLTMINRARNLVGLTDTTDPGTIESRVDLLFRERAYWFWLEGRRLGDYRRLVSQYGRDPYYVYPVGSYNKGTTETTPIYGEAFVFSPPVTEFENNYKYTGCENVNP